ncbi:MAG: SDR family oxidoreductase [Gemmatimonadales bacterium]|nr:MAG: SDR family oxidoreductase [Gemmatimonadales bacterium]
MRVLVIGANGKTGRIIVDRLREGAHDPVAMVRSEAQIQRFADRGVDTVLADLEEPLDPALEGCDAVIFAAGSGSSTGPDKTLSVDRDGAVRSIAAVEEVGIQRYIMLSAMRADPESEGDPISHYLRAKGIADEHLIRSDLDWTIVRPGRLTDEPGTGRVRVAPRIETSGSVTRSDTAAVLVAALDHPSASRRRFDLLEGDIPIATALDGL